MRPSGRLRSRLAPDSKTTRSGGSRMRTYWPFLAALLPLLTAGCVTMDKVWPCCGGEKPPCGPVHQVIVTWNNEVMRAADPTHNGALVPGIGGRLFLFGPEIGFPLAGDGSIT